MPSGDALGMAAARGEEQEASMEAASNRRLEGQADRRRWNEDQRQRMDELLPKATGRWVLPQMLSVSDRRHHRCPGDDPGCSLMCRALGNKLWARLILEIAAICACLTAVAPAMHLCSCVVLAAVCNRMTVFLFKATLRMQLALGLLRLHTSTLRE